MAEPDNPIKAANGIEIPLDEWVRLIICETVKEALERHGKTCPARRMFWLLIGGGVTLFVGVVILLVRAAIAG